MRVRKFIGLVRSASHFIVRECNLINAHNIKLQHPVVLHRSDFAFRFFCRLCATLVNILPPFSCYCLYMFRPNRPSSGVQVVVMKQSAADCKQM
jgi:hypothetical protein